MSASAGLSDTSIPRPKRRYRLSPEGRASLKQTAAANRPWAKSTGPRTAEGKDRAKMNAFQHGARSAEAAGRRKTIRRLLKFLQAPECTGHEVTSIPLDPHTVAHLEEMRRLLS